MRKKSSTRARVPSTLTKTTVPHNRSHVARWYIALDNLVLRTSKAESGQLAKTWCHSIVEAGAGFGIEQDAPSRAIQLYARLCSGLIYPKHSMHSTPWS
ncbi:hypothetical protein LMH87_011921 [Akanthomyces muscarius]|uniref:Uncharacterized protein n=1 Tax=Akanthomyces muscarius TaxID=2231603 RepID=A0A9W8UKE6_AKAMU|nr:hypothetical protein LMH87_011921 [Akanthomyces muscarius]KAJ4151207.1 hypothetical protein LMH87_011921 [Akanthomyces muscarius]